MNQGRIFALLVAIANLALIWLFPPYDYVSALQGNVPTFDGFFFRFAESNNRLINTNFLTLELIVVLINLGIAWLLIRNPTALDNAQQRVNRGQRMLLAAVGANLILLLLFPPFENFVAISKAVLPSFEGFYFIFGNNSQRLIVTPLLYLEVTLVLINAGLLWLFLRDKPVDPISSTRLGELARDVQRAQSRVQSL
jgi:hypothetical protein